jgi:general stress protein 26
VDAGIDAAGRRAGFDPDEASPLAAIRRTTAPVLLVHGREDRNIPCTHSVRLQAAAPPGSRLVLLDGEDHFSITRSGSERTRREIRTWFRRWLAAAPRPPGAPGAVVSAGRDVVQHPQPPIQAGSAAMNLTDRERVVRILQANRSHAFLATSSDSQPYCRVVAPLVEDDLAIWIATFQGSRKVGQIQHNARVCLSFLEIPGYTREANVYGEAAIVTDPASKRRVWSLAAGELARYFPAGPDSEVFCLLRVTARRVEWREGDGPGYRILTIP